jgi:Papain family cysteine protease
MATLVRKAALPLGEMNVVSEESRQRLAALSVTTAEELLGMIAADPEATAEFLGDGDLAGLQADLGREAGPKAMASLAEVGERHFALGAAPPPHIEVEERADPQVFERRVLPAAASQEDVPTELEADISGCMGPLRSQGDRSTCVAHAVCAMAECLISRSTGESLDLSEQFLYWNSKRIDGEPNDPGTFIKVATELSVSDGNCLEATWPYNPQIVEGNEGQDPPPASAGPEAATRLLSAAVPVTERSPQAIRDALDEGKPVALSVPVYQNWDGNPAVNASGEIPMPLPRSKLVSGHAMCAVGYGSDPAMAGRGAFVLRNSWGADWAPQSRVAPGHALLPYLYLELYGWECFTAAP